MTYREALARLEAVGTEAGFGIKPDLDRISRLVQVLDHPETTYPSVHVAGTNGKTSTVRAIAAILGAHGITTGFYTSPHLQSPRERFGMAGITEEAVLVENIDEVAFAATYEYLDPFIQMVEDDLRSRVTYFETTTAIAFEWFADVAVGAAVFETGMGGTWDATNVIAPSVAVLTPIDVDHVDRLGPTALDGAREKAGIIKAGVPVISAVQRPEVADHISEVCGRLGAPLLKLGSDLMVSDLAPAVEGISPSIKGTRGAYGQLFVPLLGAHQSSNVAIAIAACETFLDGPLDADALQAGLLAITSPGRLEVVSRDPAIVLDGAHNPHGAHALVSALRASFGDVPLTFIVAAMEDKDVGGILNALVEASDTFVVTRIDSPRSLEPEKLASAPALASKKVSVTQGMREAISHAAAISPKEGMIVVTGSLYAVGEARTILVGPVA